MKIRELGADAPTESLPTRPLDLSKSRRIKGISLEEIAERTKISLRFLRAIEAEEFEQLPGGIFNTSYLRQYAAAAGFDEAELLAHYNRAAPCERSAGSGEGRRTRGFLDRWLRTPLQAR